MGILSRLNLPTAILLVGALFAFCFLLWMLRANLEVEHALASVVVVALTIGAAVARQLFLPAVGETTPP